MVDVLEADWEIRERMTEDEAKEKSLIVRFIDSGRAIAGRERKIVRAVFADGRMKSVVEFGEIWKNETKELKKDGDVKKADKKINIEADSYGDYMEDENEADMEDSASEASTPPSDVGNYQTDSIPNVADSLGGMDSINLRVRLLSLLSKVSAFVPEAFTSLNTLYDIYLEHIRSLPMPRLLPYHFTSNPKSFRPRSSSYTYPVHTSVNNRRVCTESTKRRSFTRRTGGKLSALRGEYEQCRRQH